MTYEEMLLEAIAENPFADVTIESVVAQIMDGSAQLWRGPQSVAVTERGPRGRLHVFLAAGDMRELIEVLLPQARVYAAENGYTGLSLNGRPGWERALKSIGATPVSVYCEF